MDVTTDSRGLPNGRETPINGEISEVIHEELYQRSRRPSSKCIIYLEIIGFLSMITVVVVLAVFYRRKQTLDFKFPFRKTNHSLAVFVTIEVVLSFVGLVCICDSARRLGCMKSLSSSQNINHKNINVGMGKWKFCRRKPSSNCIYSVLQLFAFLSLVPTGVVLAVSYHRKQTLFFKFPFRKTNHSLAVFVAIEVVLSLVGLVCICDLAKRIGCMKFTSSRRGNIKDGMTKWKFCKKKPSSNCLASILEVIGFLSLIATAAVLAVFYRNKQTISFEFSFGKTNRRFAVLVAIEILLSVAGLGCIFCLLRRIRSTQFVSKRSGSLEVAKSTIKRKYESNNRWEEVDTQTRNELWST